MIELPNPRAGIVVDGVPQPLTVKVFRAWTDQDVRDATKTITRPEDGEAFTEEMNQLFKSFELNSIEVERAVRTIVPKLRCQIKGNWDPLLSDDPIPFGHAEYAGRTDPLLATVVAHYRGQANYSRVAECKQTPTESVTLFVTRMKKVFCIHSGIPIDQSIQHAIEICTLDRT